jgi:hypothetical protein
MPAGREVELESGDFFGGKAHGTGLGAAGLQAATDEASPLVLCVKRSNKIA